ncbi:MAG TPA: hypothetical protein VEB60_02135 [Candidatus Paceibacterota bacterium]|nr:hypothetical protein [Candidatus Paceibacterota bacterium]
MQRFFDTLFVRVMQRWGMTLLRWSLGIVFLWFGLLKVFGASPVLPMLTETYGFVPMEMSNFVIILGLLETVIGLGLLFKIALRATIALLWLQMVGVFAAVFLAPEVFYAANPFFLTLDGEFVAKNIVIIAASLAIGGHELKY